MLLIMLLVYIMDTPQKTFSEELNDIEKTFYLLMQNYNKNYVLSKTSKNENDKKFFLNTETNIHDLLRKFNSLKESVHTTIKTVKKDFSEEDKIIKNLKKINKELLKKENELVVSTGASVPFEQQVKENNKFSTLEYTYYSFGVLGIGYLIYSSVRS